MSIRNLSAVSAVTSSDSVAIDSASLGGDARATLTTLLTWLQSQLQATGGFVSAYVAPLTGFSHQVAPPVAGENVFLIVSPAGTIATGTIVLPVSPVHGQELMVSTTNTVTALTISGGTVSGAPTTITAAIPFRLRYDGVLSLWLRVL